MTEQVRISRPVAGVLSLSGTTSSYAVDPMGETVIGVITRGTMEAQRGDARHVFGPGDVCVWDGSGPHRGRPATGAAWEARLLVVEGGPVRLPGPRIADRALARRFVTLHRELETTALAEAELLALLDDLAGPPPAACSRACRDPALRRAVELLDADPTANVTLGELAARAGVNRHRLARLFRAAYGLPPHRFQLARRVRLARSLLERGVPPAEVAAQAGFGDQSHLHRHFRRTLGITPGRYAAALRPNVQDTQAAHA